MRLALDAAEGGACSLPCNELTPRSSPSSLPLKADRESSCMRYVDWISLCHLDEAQFLLERVQTSLGRTVTRAHLLSMAEHVQLFTSPLYVLCLLQCGNASSDLFPQKAYYCESETNGRTRNDDPTCDFPPAACVTVINGRSSVQTSTADAMELRERRN